MLELKLLSSLEKVFLKKTLPSTAFSRLTALRNEVISFQCAVKSSVVGNAVVTLQTQLPKSRIRQVVNMPSMMPGNIEDEMVLSAEPGLYPDALLPIENNQYHIVAGFWQSLWITLPIALDTKAGTYQILVSLSLYDPIFIDKQLYSAEAEFTLELLNETLQDQQLIRSEWLHGDCIYKYYNVPCWGVKHWQLLEQYFRNAVEHGINMLFSPLWTPPIDTAQGGDRPTIQLLEISETDGKYHFDFSRLEQWIRLGKECGFKYFEFSHLFTQWGAAFTPKIIVNGQKRFGWHVPVDSPEYGEFLKQLLPQLLDVLTCFDIKKQSFFHISDEPSLKQMENYRSGRNLVRPLLRDVPVIDAVSDPLFYHSGLVDIPIPSNDHLEEFTKFDLPLRFTYYCSGQWNKVPNRFFNHSSARNRIMGILLYLNKMDGFLQWGYNFWYGFLSHNVDLNPFMTTDANGYFPSGDSFAVYPGAKGPFDSLRHEVFTEALQDLRALQQLDKRIGYDAVVELIEGQIGYRPSMKRYPNNADYILQLRDRINRMLIMSQIL